VLNIPYAQKLVWTHTLELLGDEAQVDAHFSTFGDNVSVSAR
jgi:hypothetical protein